MFSFVQKMPQQEPIFKELRETVAATAYGADVGKKLLGRSVDTACRPLL
jgi:hypothetical protein